MRAGYICTDGMREVWCIVPWNGLRYRRWKVSGCSRMALSRMSGRRVAGWIWIWVECVFR